MMNKVILRRGRMCSIVKPLIQVVMIEEGMPRGRESTAMTLTTAYTQRAILDSHVPGDKCEAGCITSDDQNRCNEPN